MIDRRLVTHFDWVLFFMLIILFTISLAEIYSAVNAGSLQSGSVFVLKQGIWFSVGAIIFFIIILIDFHTFEQWAIFFYWCVNGLLIYVLYNGKLVGGSQRWIDLGFASVQPSELAKIAVILVLARHFSRNMFAGGVGFKQLIMPMFYVAVPFSLIAKQPDLGTAGIIVLIAAFITLFVKIEKKTFFMLCAMALVFGVSFYKFFLKEYQRERIITFLNPDKDPLDAGYHIIQSKIAIGSGMFYGKGYQQGTQNALSFLPEQHTDFIFSVYAEEWGFLGSLFFLFFYFFVLVWGLKIAGRCRSVFGVLLCVGIISLIFWQLFINLGMVMGLFPVVGMPLPLISYGGSSVMTIIMAMAILMNISMRRFMSR